MRTVRVAGFRVVLGTVWLAGAALLVVSLVATLPVGTAPPLTGTTSLVVALIVAVLLAIVMFGLEVCRAIVARERGRPPAEVRVLAMGLPPAPDPPPTSPMDEILIAASAPVAGGVLGAALVGASRLVEGGAADSTAALHWALTWLGVGMLVVAAFLSLPLLPLDGGRIVRAAVWGATGDLPRATRIAASVGRGFGYLVLGSGLLVTLAGELLVGLWLLLLGWLATRVAGASAERTRLEELTAGLTVADAIDAAPPTVGPTLTLDALLTQAARPDDRGVYPVVDGGRLTGVVFVQRISRRSRGRAAELRAADVMIPHERARPLRSADPLLEAVVRMEGGRIDALPVVSADDPTRLVGLVTRDRVLDRMRARQALGSARGERGGPARG